MSLYKLFKTDQKVEQDGVWIDYGDAGRILIARAGGTNEPYLKAIEKRALKYRRSIQNQTIPRNLLRNILVDVFADTIILDWEGVKDEHGNEMPFNRENVVKILTDLPDLFNDLQEQAADINLFKQEIEETDAGN